METKLKRVALLALLLILALALVPARAQDDTLPAAEITNDEGGTAIITGEVNYTVGFLSSFGADAILVMLSDISYQVDRNRDYVLPVDAQVIGQVTSDPLVTPFTYQVNLPIVPPGESRDVDNNGRQDEGVRILRVWVTINMLGGPYWQEGEYEAGFSSTRDSNAFERRHEITGGSVIVWAPDDEQGFPSGFGEDGLLFTDDDPIVRLPQGYTVVNLDSDPFTFDRSFTAVVDLIQSANLSLAPADFSNLGYTAAFDALVDLLRSKYSFTEYKNIDWDALSAQFRPRIVAAEADGSRLEYERALRDFTWSIPDGHVGVSTPQADAIDFWASTEGSIGMAIRELDDGRVIVHHLYEDSPAARAGVQPRAEIIAINDIPIQEALEQVTPYSLPFSTAHNLRLQQLRYITRYPRGIEVELTYRNPGDSGPSTITVETIEERETWLLSSITYGAAGPNAQPVEFEFLDNGFGYVRINSFARDPLLTLRLWEWVIQSILNADAPGLIIDMRHNGGGFNIYNQMAAYFFEEALVIGNDAEYYEDLDGFFVDPVREERLILPPSGLHYGGPVAVLVSPNCASACEFFSYIMTLNNRAAIVGMYPTAGLGGNISPVFMPERLRLQYTSGRQLNADGEIAFEGTGIVPTVRVPVNELTLFSDGDPILEKAIGHLERASFIPVVDGGELVLGQPVQGRIFPGERIRFTYQVGDPVTLDWVIAGEAETVLRVYVNDETEPRLVSEQKLFTGIPVAGGLRLTFEIGGLNDAASGAFSLTISLNTGEGSGNGGTG